LNGGVANIGTINGGLVQVGGGNIGAVNLGGRFQTESSHLLGEGRSIGARPVENGLNRLDDDQEISSHRPVVDV
jgi:hypothetical protein